MSGPGVAEPWITPDWPVPRGVRAVSTTRGGGVSEPPYDSLNLGTHVGDDERAVTENRARLCRSLDLPGSPRWLRQVHGRCAVSATQAPPDCIADASYTDRPGVVCAVLTADCLPVLLCDSRGRRVGAAHAGWRGLAAGVLEQTVAAMELDRDALVWLGPAIGPERFEIGAEVRQAFLAHDAGAGLAFRHVAEGRWRADLYQLARRRLARCGITRIYGGHWCTAGDAQRFFSYRRDGATTGRMGTLIWLDSDTASSR